MHLVSPVERSSLARLVDRVLLAAVAPGAGVSCVEIGGGSVQAVEVMRATAPHLDRLGFLVCRAVSRPSARLERDLQRRHVALFATSARECDEAATWIRRLAAGHGRRHVLVHIVRREAADAEPVLDDRSRQEMAAALGRTGVLCAEDRRDEATRLLRTTFDRTEPWRARVAMAAPLVRLIEEAGRRDEAQALSSALEAEAVCRGRPAPLATWACPQPGSEPGGRAGVEGRWGMALLHAVPRLLQIVHDTEDETTVLRRGCAWLCEETGAAGAGVIAREGARVMATHTFDVRDVPSPFVDECFRGSHARAMVDEGVAHVAVPMRYGGCTIGLVIARGPASVVETMEEAAAALGSVLAVALRARLDAIALAGAGHRLANDILGDSPAIAELRESIARAAATTFPVMVEGESGTGKELVARALHRLSARRDRRFAAVNCAALTDDLVEAEMFGHVRGAFTGAIGPRAGLFEDAHGGTLFLDEVAELSARAQAKLLRVLQEREIRRLGENVSRQVDVRVVGATNLPLADAVGSGRFREDLRFRLAVVRIRVPPLRERIEDVPLLARAFWKRLSADAPTRACLGPDAVASLCRYGWPGNVRELQNVVSALVVSAPSRGVVTSRHVSAALGVSSAEDVAVMRLDAAVRGFERRMVAAALARNGGRRTRAARELGLTRQGLTKAIRRLGLRPPPARTAGVA
jgi:DNA-binding NtrC family response regulator